MRTKYARNRMAKIAVTNQGNDESQAFASTLDSLKPTGITSKVDFMNRLRGLSLRLRQQGFLTNLLQRTFTKFFNRHGLIVVKYDATLREMRFAIQA